MLYGVDVSSFQGNYNWTNEAFGFCKATEGTFYRDKYFGYNWNMMWSKKILRGAYHFAHPGTDPVAQAKYFVAYVKQHGLTANDVLALDLEVSDCKTPSQVGSWAVSFVREVQALTGKNVWVYCSGSYASSAYTSGLRNQPLWIANPNGKAGAVSSYAWGNWTAHQYSWQPVDKDVFNGTAATWSLLANVVKPHSAPVKPAPVITPVKTAAKTVLPASVLGTQDGWYWCHKCGGMFYASNDGKTSCPSGGDHDGSKSKNYRMSFTSYS